MDDMRSPGVSSSEDEGNPQASSQECLQDRSNSKSQPSSPSVNTRSIEKPKLSIPIHKRRRVTRACDECRRKKIKCDGKQPCVHCTVYSYDCTYDQPSNRRRNPAPAYIEALESRLQKSEAILRTALPGVNIDDLESDAHNIDQIMDASRRTKPRAQPADQPQGSNLVPDDDAQLQTMVESTGSLDLDDQGHWDYHGSSSGFTFIRNLRAQFGVSFMPDPRVPHSRSRAMSHLIESPKSASSSSYDFSIPPAADLPDRDTTMRLCRNTLEVACALMRFVHKPNFYRKVTRIFETEPDHYTNSDTQFLPLLFVVMAVGCLFAQTENTMLDTHGYGVAIEQGFQYFETARNMLDITDCRDINTLQATVFMIMFLQSTAKLSTCYSYIGVALRACCRLGVHRNIKNEFNPIEQEERKRIFWLVRKMDAYVGAILGLPQMLSQEDVDQQLPTEVDDDFITDEGVLPMPPDRFPLLRATNAHTNLVCILQKVMRFIYPIKGWKGANAGEPCSISHGRIRDIEKDLQVWMDNLPMELRPSDDVSSELARVQQLLRLSYAHVQMMMYRPFLHYVSQGSEKRPVDKRSYACAAACISVARNIVHITAEMNRRGLLIGSYWFVMYTSYFAIISLIFFVVENPQSPNRHEIMRDATEGRDMLASLSKRSLAADRCSLSLQGLFADLPVKLQERKSSSQSLPRKRPNPGPTLAEKGSKNVSNALRRAEHDSPRAPNPSTAFSNKELVASAAPQSTVAHSSGVHASFNNSPLHRTGPENPTPISAATGTESLRRTPVEGAGSFLQPVPFDAQLGDTVADLRGLMYPSTNPFAYGNQPLAILENNQTITQEQRASIAGPTSAFGAAGSNSEGEMAFGGFQNPVFADSPQQGIYRSDVPGPTLATGSNRPGFPMVMPTGPQELGHLNTDETFWQQMGKGRTGLMPGVNLDELLGSDGAWNPMYMDQGYERTG